MRSGVIAQKVGMTRIFTDAGEHIPVTVLKLDNCQVVAHRTKDKNGYVAVQVGVGTAKVKNVSKAQRGHFAVASVEPKRKLAEFRVSDEALIPVGAELTADHFVVGQLSRVEAEVRQEEIHLFDSQFDKTLGGLGEIGLEQDDLAGQGLQSLAGPLKRPRIDVQAHERPFGAQSRTEQKTMTSVSNGRIDHHPILR